MKESWFGIYKVFHKEMLSQKDEALDTGNILNNYYEKNAILNNQKMSLAVAFLII